MSDPKRDIVYLVDDDDPVRDATQLLLETCGFQVRAFPSAATFLAGFSYGSAACILLDLHMPKMGGLELVQALRSWGTRTPVIIMSGRRDAALDVELQAAGVSAILSKPCEDEALLGAIRAVFGKD
jgi:two-component system, LuxR family, response regulator FixJ